MDVLQLAAIKLAKEVDNGSCFQFSHTNQTLAACLELLTELESRVPGFKPNQYVYAINSAIDKTSINCNNLYIN